MNSTTSIELTPLQRQALVQSGEAPVRLIDPDTQKEYVLLKAELYQRLERLLYDASEPGPQQGYALTDAALKEDWDDPKMAEYDRYEDHKK